MPLLSADGWPLSPETFRGSREVSHGPRLGELPPYPTLSSIIRVRRPAHLTRDSSALPESLASDVECILWDTYDKMAPVEHRSAGISGQPFYRGRLRLDRHAVMSNNPVAAQIHGQINPVHGQSSFIDSDTSDSFTDPKFSSMELFENAASGSCDSKKGESAAPCQNIQTGPLDTLLRQPETRPMSHNQLVDEVRGIYAGLLMADAQCIDVDKTHYGTSAGRMSSLDVRFRSEDNQWLPLEEHQKERCNSHNNCSPTLQHPLKTNDSNTPTCSSKFSQTWQPSILSSFGDLGVLLAFAILRFCEADGRRELQAFEDSWIECLEDSGRYRVAMDEDKRRDREVWSDVARLWYTKAAESNSNLRRSPSHNHLNTLASRYRPAHWLLSLSETSAMAPFHSTEPDKTPIRDRPLIEAQPGKVDHSPSSPDAEIIDLPDHNDTSFAVAVRNTDRSLATPHLSIANLPPTPLTILPAPVPCLQWQQPSLSARYIRLYRSVRPCYTLIALGILTIVGSLAPAIWRSAKRNDLSGGFSLAQYILGAGVFIIGSMVAIHSKTCTCWE